MKQIDAFGHVSGSSVYVDDIPEQRGTLHAVPVYSEVAHARILQIRTDRAKKAKGVVAVFTAKDVPGENQIGGIIPDEPLFAEDEIHFIGQPFAVIVADSHFAAKEARSLVDLEYEELEVITDPREAMKKGNLLFPSRTFATGDVEKSLAASEHVFSGRANSGGQEHLYIETQGSYAIPQENHKIRIHSSTQGPTMVQKTAARVLGVQMHSIEVDVIRLGGAFGGKEDQATAWAVMAALSSKILNRPVKLILDRDDDMLLTGKRHPYSSDFRIGLDKDLKITSYEVSFFQNGGAAADLSSSIMERTLLHTTSTYFIPNVRASGYYCKTNMVPFTAFRGFGAPQAMFVIESAIAFAARELGVDKSLIQERNLISPGTSFPYGQVCRSGNAKKSWETLYSHFSVNEEKQRVREFNLSNALAKKGLSIMPICFGISFSKTSMNQARALVHVYQDGSVEINTGAIEMGQGVNTKLIQVASGIFHIDCSRVRIGSTNTTRVANTSPTAASSGADLNGKALQIACNAIADRLKRNAAEVLQADPALVRLGNERVYVDDKASDLDWDQLVETAFLSRVKLSEVGHYATPLIYFDRSQEKGHPFAYHVFGTAMTIVQLDCMKGTYEIDTVKLVHDSGSNMFKSIDRGQIEGGIVQGIGWMTLEELSYDEKGMLLADSLSKYKVPDAFMAPGSIEISALETEGDELALLGSKAVGEPPFMYGIGAYFALQKAIVAFNPAYTPKYDAPLTPEKALLALYELKS